jgi:hypothetical protein
MPSMLPRYPGLVANHVHLPFPVESIARRISKKSYGDSGEPGLCRHFAVKRGLIQI